MNSNDYYTNVTRRDELGEDVYDLLENGRDDFYPEGTLVGALWDAYAPREKRHELVIRLDDLSYWKLEALRKSSETLMREGWEPTLSAAAAYCVHRVLGRRDRHWPGRATQAEKRRLGEAEEKRKAESEAPKK